MKKTAIILGLLILNFQFSIFNSAMAQDAKHELSLSFQGLGLGSMPFWGQIPGPKAVREKTKRGQSCH